MNIFVVGLIIFIMSLLVIELAFHAAHVFMHPDRGEIRKRLKRTVSEAPDDEDGSIIKKRVLSEVPFLDRMLEFLPGIERIELAVKQANLKYSPGFFLLLSLTLSLGAYLFASILTRNSALSILVAMVSLCLPTLYLKKQKRKRMEKFEKQLPEALGFLARALKAGHAFTSGMKLVSEEFEDPLGPEFEEAVDEINFGLAVSDALKNMVNRVECPDLRFFAVSVILQRETGGNLAEIIEGLAHLIRERFRFRRKVKTITAEGRLSGVILMAIPFALFFVLHIIAQEYASTLYTDPIGITLTVGALIMMFIGMFVIKRIVKLDV